jgi:transketolase
MLEAYGKAHPAEAKNLKHMREGTLPEGWDRFCKEFPADSKGVATRQSSADCLNMVAEGIPWMLGGSADLAHSCLTVLKFKGVTDFMAPVTGWGDFSGRNFHFGIREHAMGSICNGMAVSHLRPFCSTFLVFSDYMKPPIRVSSIMETPCIWIFTHDSIGVGEDGPTHQPIEHLSALRSIPGLLTFRPGDANETLHMWKHIATLKTEPAAVALSRQNLPTLDRAKYASAAGVSRGAYVLAGAEHERPEVILMASGSEVALMLEAHDALVAEDVKVRSVSVPCMELFKEQSAAYVESVLPFGCRARVSIEAATSDSWRWLIGLDGEHVGMITFGESGPLKSIAKTLGFTKEALLAATRRVMRKQPRSLESEADVMRQWKKRKAVSASDL